MIERRSMFLSVKRLNRNLWFFALCYGKEYKFSGIAKTKKEAFQLSWNVCELLLKNTRASTV